jgi:hypothetical protein
MEIRDSATRQKYLEAKEFIKEYEEEWNKVMRVKDYSTWRLYELRSEIESIRKRRNSATEERIKNRMNYIKEILKEKYEKCNRGT